MHAFSKLILEKYQVRKTKKQKTEFIELIKKEFANHQITIEEGGLFKSRNIIIGDLENSQVVLGAHYDTAPVLPFPNFLAPKNMVAYLIYCLLLCALFMGIVFVFGNIISIFTNSVLLITILNEMLLFGIIVWMLIGKANQHTANDNTSGVITLIEALKDESLKDKVCCVFFDHEESGLFGSSLFNKMHRNLMKNKLLINFDCVSDGDTIMVIYSKSMKKNISKLKERFVSKDNKEVLITPASKTLYPSDQMSFKHYLGVAAFKKNKWIGYYMDRIHTSKDTIFDEKNIEVIIEGVRNYVS